MPKVPCVSVLVGLFHCCGQDAEETNDVGVEFQLYEMNGDVDTVLDTVMTEGCMSEMLSVERITDVVGATHSNVTPVILGSGGIIARRSVDTAVASVS